MAARERGTWLTTAAVLLALLAVSNASKPLEIGSRTGFVFLGQRQHGTWNAVLGPLFGAYLAAYAYGVWAMRRFALPMAWLYAGYVLLNLVLFPFRTPPPPDAGMGERIFGMVYATVALAFTFGTARVLSRRSGDLQ